MSGKVLVLKLGSECNLKCKHCHCAQSSYKLNEDIFAYINGECFKRVTFCGGEPLLYFDIIKTAVSRLPSEMSYKLVSNGTKLSREMVEYFNEHNFRIIFSYDGDNDSRDQTYLQCWSELARMKKQGIATLFSEENRDTAKLADEIHRVRSQYKLSGVGSSVWVNFPHQTAVNRNAETDRQLAKEYCAFVAGQIELDFRRYKKAPQRGDLSALGMGFLHWVYKSKAINGVKCCNDNLVIMTLSGDFLLCPYEPYTIGDIYTGRDWSKVQSIIPERCKNCEIWDSCRNTCIMNVTDNECFISRVMNRHIRKLMKKYDVSYEQLAERFTRRKAIPNQTE